MHVPLPRVIRRRLKLLRPLLALLTLTALVLLLTRRRRLPSSLDDPLYQPLPVPDYARNTRFRQRADPRLEATAEAALRDIEAAIRGEEDPAAATAADAYPMRRIWQTASDEPGRTRDARAWERRNPGWNYTVPSTRPPGAHEATRQDRRSC